MDPAVIIAAVSLVTTVAMAFVSRGNQRNDKLEERVGGLESRMSSQETHTQNIRGDLGEMKSELKSIKELLIKALGLQ